MKRAWRVRRPGSAAFAAGLVAVFALGGCVASEPEPLSARGAPANPLIDLLEAQRERFAPLLDAPAEHRIQILYTRIDRDADGTPRFTDHGFRVDAEYFYPASTIKLPVAVLALEKLHRLDVEGLDRDTPMLTGAGTADQTPALTHPRAPDGVPSVGHYVREIFAVSDNDAFNRLYEFVGQAPLHRALRARGLTETRILHRLSIPLPLEANRVTNPVRFERDGVAIHAQPLQRSTLDLRGPRSIPLGRGEMIGTRLVRGPKEFAEKNAYPLAELHGTLRRVLFPESVQAAQRFHLAADDRAFLLRAMGQTPGETSIEAYADRDAWPDGHVKFLLLGGSARELPPGLRIFNKVGQAYGFLIDSAYVVDFEAGVEFMLSATVQVNDNGIYNDNVYEYDTLGLPFLAELGTAVLEMERARPRRHAPDLSALRSLFDAP